MKENDIQSAFDSLAQWEQDLFIENNEEQLLSDINTETPNLEDIDTDDIVEWLFDNCDLTTDELLDAVVDDLEYLREIVVEGRMR